MLVETGSGGTVPFFKIIYGKDTRHLDTVRELFKRCISIDIIAESTQLPKEEIEKLATEIQKDK